MSILGILVVALVIVVAAAYLKAGFTLAQKVAPIEPNSDCVLQVTSAMVQLFLAVHLPATLLAFVAASASDTK